jgi:hypothetical protein
LLQTSFKLMILNSGRIWVSSATVLSKAVALYEANKRNNP